MQVDPQTTGVKRMIWLASQRAPCLVLNRGRVDPAVLTYWQRHGDSAKVELGDHVYHLWLPKAEVLSVEQREEESMSTYFTWDLTPEGAEPDADEVPDFNDDLPYELVKERDPADAAA